MFSTCPRIFIIWLMVSLSCAAAADAAELKGVVTHVRDGDTFEVNGVAVRLNGLHAPERASLSGKRATAFMTDLVLNKPVVCHLNGEVSYDRLVGICWLGERDVAAALIGAGLGRDCPRYSGGRYAALEPETVNTMRLPKYCKSR